MKISDLQKKKLSSRRFWIVVWACLMITFWGTYALLNDLAPAWLAAAIALLIAIPTAYVTVTSIKKKEGE